MKELIKRFLKYVPFKVTQNQFYDYQTTKILRKYLDVNSNCIDVGCHKGEILELILRCAPSGKHFGLEPIPVFAELLRNKFKSNANISILEYAASNDIGHTTFNYVVSNPSYSGILKRSYDKPDEIDETIEVDMDRLDNLIPHDLPIHLIKIDVEGGEYQVLSGAQDILSRWKPIVIFEHGLGGSDQYGTTPQMVYSLIKSTGLVVNTLHGFLDKKAQLTLQGFEEQYFKKINYYFIAYDQKKPH